VDDAREISSDRHCAWRLVTQETVPVNRGLPVTVFSSVNEAEKWLQRKDRRRAQPGPAEAKEPLG
jgi:hypothetical protein